MLDSSRTEVHWHLAVQTIDWFKRDETIEKNSSELKT